MNCPPEIAALLLEITRRGIIRSRAAAWAGDAPRCAIETDHIHNLPDLVANFDESRLVYYWEAERLGFIEQIGAERTEEFDRLWQSLQLIVKLPTSMSA